MLKNLALLVTLVFSIFPQAYATSSVDSFGVINITQSKMSLETISGDNGITIDTNCLLPSDIPTTNFPHPDSTGCSGNIGANGGSVNYTVKVKGKSFFSRSSEYDITLDWNAKKEGTITKFTCASSSCSTPTSDFNLSARYDSFDGYNLVIQQNN